MEVTGRVFKKKIAIGSKSERDAVCLVSGGQEYVLRRKDGNEFYDPKLEKLVGKEIRVAGDILGGYMLQMSKWTEV
jgi:hypothetical protein